MTSIMIDRTDGLSSAAAIKGPCKAATTANITLYGEQTIDGVAIVTGDRVLVKNQTAGYENGIYVADTGQWRRSKDFNRTNDVVEGTAVFVTDGTVNSETLWSVTSSNPVVVGTSTITFSNGIIVPPDDSVGPDQLQDGAVEPSKIDPDGDFQSLGFTAWTSGEYRTLRERARDIYCILDAPGSPDPTGVNDSTTALKAMVAEGIRCEVTKGDFVTEEPLLLKTTGQNLFGAGMGYGYGRPNYSMLDFEPMSRIIAAGTFATRIMTRRKHRASVADPKDDPMSSVLDIEADGVTLSDLAIWLNTDWSDVTPSNYGDDVDIGIFVGCRPGIKMRNVGVFGHFRRAGIYLDVTRALELPELNDWDGNPLPDGASGESFSGGDGTVLDDLFIYGALGPGLAVLGAIHPGGNYYDEATGLVSDMRGASGFSDFRVRGGRFYSTQHQSGRRTRNPTGYGVALTRSNMEAEEDFFPACVYIDGWASNSGSTTHGVGALRNMSFLGSRFSGCEAFRVRLGQCDQVKFLDTTWIETGDSPSGTSLWKDTSGVDINVSDYTNNTYGHIATHQTNTGMVSAQDVVGGLNQTWVYSKQRLRASDAYGREMMQGNWVRADTTTALPTGMAAIRHAYDDGLASEYGGDIIESFRPFAYLKDRSSGNAMGWRYDSGVYQLKQGAHTAGVIPANTLMTFTEAGAHYSGEVTIADDAVATLTPPSTGGRISVTLGPDTTGPQAGRSGTAFYDAGTSLEMRLIENGANFAISAANGTTNLTGTTGTDGNVTLCVQTGVVKIENRAGGSAVFRYLWLP